MTDRQKEVTGTWDGITNHRRRNGGYDSVFIGKVTGGTKDAIGRRLEFFIAPEQAEYAILHLIPDEVQGGYVPTQIRNKQRAKWLRDLADKLEKGERPS